MLKNARTSYFANLIKSNLVLHNQQHRFTSFSFIKCFSNFFIHFTKLSSSGPASLSHRSFVWSLLWPLILLLPVSVLMFSPHFFLKIFLSGVAPVKADTFFSLFPTASKQLWSSAHLDSCFAEIYRPVSKPPEKVVAEQLTWFLEDNDMMDTFQSGFHKLCSSETASLKVWSDLLMAADCAAIKPNIHKMF